MQSRPFTAVLLALSLFGSLRILPAGDGTIVQLPFSGTKVKNGLQLSIDTRWLDGRGYRPVRLKVNTVPPIPARADRTLRVQIRFYGWRYGYQSPNTTTFIELPQGASSAEVTLPVPLSDSWSMLDVQVFEDGARLDDLSGRAGLPLRVYNNGQTGNPTVLLVDESIPLRSERRGLTWNLPSTLAADPGSAGKIPDIRGIAILTVNSQQADFQQLQIAYTRDELTDVEGLNLIENLPRLEVLHPNDLPSEWICLTSVDLLAISGTVLENLTRAPEKLEALKSWAAAGGTLIVWGLGEHPDRRKQLEETMGVSSSSSLEPAVDTGRGWKPAAADTYRTEVTGLDPALGVTGMGIPLPTSAVVPGMNMLNQLPPQPEVPPFHWREYGLGVLVAWDEAQPFDKTTWRWQWLLNSLTQDRWSWYRRHGLAVQDVNREYWNWLIPGVGRAPVFGFLILISLFVVLTGPVNYYVLRRRKRVAWLLMTVPLSAAVVTCGLFSYALVKDGLGVRARVRSITQLDQATGRTVSWSRQTYYAGLTPSQGLMFPKDTAIYPVEHRTDQSYRSSGSRRSVVWSDEQILRSGFLSPRSMAQFLVVRAGQSELRLEVGTPRPEGLPVTNGLQSRLERLVLRDAGGEFYFGEQIAAGENRMLRRTSAKELKRLFNVDRDHAVPAFPPDLDPDLLGRAYYWMPQFMATRSYGGPGISTSLRNSVLERELKQAEPLNLDELPPLSFLAVTAQAPYVPLGYGRTREQASYHVIQGNWQP